MGSISLIGSSANGDVQDPVLDGDTLQEMARARVERMVKELVVAARAVERASFKEIEQVVDKGIKETGRLLLGLYLAEGEAHLARTLPKEQVIQGRRYLCVGPTVRRLNTLFGVITYSRSYVRQTGTFKRRGYHPLDVELGLTSDRVSFRVLSQAARLATQMGFAEARSTLSRFIPSAPSTEVIQQTVLGLGRFCEDWFINLAPPDNDGEVLVIMVDSKGVPTARDEELARRRGKRKPENRAASRRHRGRAHRRRYPKRPRRKKGDKAKNAKMATMVVMYTLRREGDLLLGPINVRRYASFASMEQAFVHAKREAAKRGFGPGSNKLIQFVSDGDNHIADYRDHYFPGVTVTIDVIHVIEKLWDAGDCLYEEGSAELQKWVKRQKKRLYKGEARKTLREIKARLNDIPKTGPGNKSRRETLDDVHAYLEKRVEKFNYHLLVSQDLELGTGMVEGAIKHIIGKRCDHGGMRWLKERVEAVVKLRCIEANGDWDTFINWVHDGIRTQGMETGQRIRLQQRTAAPLPVVAIPAFDGPVARKRRYAERKAAMASPRALAA